MSIAAQTQPFTQPEPQARRLNQSSSSLKSVPSKKKVSYCDQLEDSLSYDLDYQVEGYEVVCRAADAEWMKKRLAVVIKEDLKSKKAALKLKYSQDFSMLEQEAAEKTAVMEQEIEVTATQEENFPPKTSSKKWWKLSTKSELNIGEATPETTSSEDKEGQRTVLVKKASILGLTVTVCKTRNRQSGRQSSATLGEETFDIESPPYAPRRSFSGLSRLSSSSKEITPPSRSSKQQTKKRMAVVEDWMTGVQLL